MPEDKKHTMPTDAGRPVGDNQNTLTARPRRIQELQIIQHFYKADPAYGSGVAEVLGLDINSIVQEKATVAAD